MESTEQAQRTVESQHFYNGGARVLRSDLKYWAGLGEGLPGGGRGYFWGKKWGRDLGVGVEGRSDPLSPLSRGLLSTSNPLLIGTHQPLAVHYQEMTASFPGLPSLRLGLQSRFSTVGSMLFTPHPPYQSAYGKTSVSLGDFRGRRLTHLLPSRPCPCCPGLCE